MSEKLSYRGRLANDGQDTILLSTKKGEAGYKITKFQVMAPDANTNLEHVVKIYTNEQSTITTDVDFNDQTLLAAAIINDTNDPHYAPTPIVIFDLVVINQDIFISSKGHDNTADINYYFELERIKLNEHEAMVTTIQNIRNG